MRWKRSSLLTWGRTCSANGLIARPERTTDLSDCIRDALNGDEIIAYGNGRSYGDSPLNTGGRMVLTQRLNRLLDFDKNSGVLVCEPGLTFAELLRIFLPLGFVAPVTPGTAHATLGGALANDVHGKNQETAGCFGRHVEWFDLVTASGAVIRVSPETNAELYNATIGGMGLTGIISALAIRLNRVTSSDMQRRYLRTKNLDETLMILLENKGKVAYSVAWIDSLTSGKRLGRGIVELADHSTSRTLKKPEEKSIPIPFEMPGWIVNRYSISLFNSMYYRHIFNTKKEHSVSLERFFYPLDRVKNWNLLYGRNGFYQFQCVVPHEGAESVVRKILSLSQTGNGASFLTVLKTFGAEGTGHLSFAMPGVTLALDFSGRGAIRELFNRLHLIVIKAGGRIYLAKDAVLSPEAFQDMYPKIDTFRKVLARVDPERRFASDMSRRLGIHNSDD